MYIVTKQQELQGANLVILSDDELAVMRELVSRANHEQPDWMGTHDQHVIHNANQALNVEV